MSLNVKLEGHLWCVYRDDEKFFSDDYRKVEEWLDHAEIASKYQKPAAGTEPLLSSRNRLPAPLRTGNATVTSSKL